MMTVVQPAAAAACGIRRGCALRGTAAVPLLEEATGDGGRSTCCVVTVSTE